VLATQITQSADETTPPVAVMIAVACPALTALGKIFQQQTKHLDRLSGFHLWHWPLLVEVIPNDITGRRDPHRVSNGSPAEEIFDPRSR
jgi:hypothetical protein